MKRATCRCVAAWGLLLGCGGLATAQDAGPNPEELFKRLDKNGDGILKKDEIGEEQLKFFERLVRIADKDGNGELTREEFLAGVKQEDRPAAGARAGGDRPAGDRPAGAPVGDGRRLFERLDANKDGKITKDEVPEEFRNRLNPVFERLGKNEITQEEFTRAMAQFADRRRDPAQLEEMFRRADANGDGKLTLDEAPEQAKQMLEGLFRRLNKDPKAGITKDEFLKAMAEAPRGEGRPAEARPGDARPGEARPAAQPGEGRPAGRPPFPRFFQLADTNGDGRISKEELAKLVERFDELDENKDGVLDPRELLGPPPFQREGRPEEARRPEGNPPANPPAGRPAAVQRPNLGEGGPLLDQIFKRQDKNGDGKISRDEAENRIKENFDQFDANKDGFLTRDEVQKWLGRLQEGRPENRRQRVRPEGDRKPDEKKPEGRKPE